MNTREIVSDLLSRLPADISLREAAREIEFAAAEREGFEPHAQENGASLGKLDCRRMRRPTCSGTL